MTRFRFQVLLTVVMLIVFGSSIHPIRVEAAAGDLDPTFGTGGRVTTDFAGNTAEGRGVAIQPDGKIVVAGTAFSSVTAGDFAVARYNRNGSLDPGFGTGGRLSVNFFAPGSIDIARCVALQPDGKILVGGLTVFITDSFALLRLNANGTPDSSFGTNGTVRTGQTPFLWMINTIALQTDGKILAAGYRAQSAPDHKDFAVARYNVDGSLDMSFGTGGIVTTDFRGFDDVANAVVVQTDGKILAVGYDSATASGGPSFIFDFALARYNTDGTLDSSFGTGGKATTDFFGSYDEARAIVIQPDHKLVVAGAATTPLVHSFTDFGLVRYNTDGSLDTAFGVNGKVMTDFGSEFDDAWALALQTDGKLVAAGRSENAQEITDFALARYTTNGSLDPTFGGGGKTKTDFFGFNDVAYGVALQTDGKIVAAGRAETGTAQPRFALARYDGVNFDICLQDDGGGGLLQFQSTSGNYQFTNCNGLTLGGTGTITNRGSVIVLEQNGPDRRLLARIDVGANKGTASLQVFAQGATFTIADRNILNNTCACGGAH